VTEEVRASEPDTVQYQITQSDEDENEVVIWEEVSLPFDQLGLRCGSGAECIVQEQGGPRTRVTVYSSLDRIELIV
jgi:hypothetical protein